MIKIKTLKDIPFDETHFIIEQTIGKDWLGGFLNEKQKK